MTTTGRRWRNHGIVLMAGLLISASILRVGPVFAAVAVANSRFGLLNKTWLPFLVRCLVAVLLLDLAKYGLHRTLHSIYYLWRVHQVHHSDPDFDVSTALRAHPIEVFLTQSAYLAGIVLLAPPAAAVLIAELMAVFQSFFEHANASLPKSIEKTAPRSLRDSRHASNPPLRECPGAVEESGRDLLLVGSALRNVCRYPSCWGTRDCDRAQRPSHGKVHGSVAYLQRAVPARSAFR